MAKHLLSVPGGCECCGSGAGLPATMGSSCKRGEAAWELLHGVSESWKAPGAPLAPMSPPQDPPEIPAARGGQELSPGLGAAQSLLQQQQRLLLVLALAWEDSRAGGCSQGLFPMRYLRWGG